MMKIPYGKNLIDLELPTQIKWQVLKKDVPFSFSRQTEIVQNGVTELIHHLGRHISQKAKLLLIVPDHTRKCNLPLIMPPLIEALKSEYNASIEILIANGSHILQPESVVRDLITPDIYNLIPTIQHDAKNESQLLYFGKTSNNTDIWLNKKIKEVDYIITIGGILYHYFAGFGGGPKMLLPGVAGYETIRQNHSLTIDKNNGRFHADSLEGEINSNPVYTDLSQVLQYVTNVLSLQVVLSPGKEIVQCKAGPILETQNQLIPHVRELYGVSSSIKADIVIASAGGFPADVNLIQAHKSIRHAGHVTRENGMLIFFAQCIDGIGSSTFLPYFKHESAQKIGEKLASEFQINGQTALSLRDLAERINIIFISNLEVSIIRQIGMTPCRTWEEATKIISEKLDNLQRGVVMPEAATTVPL